MSISELWQSILYLLQVSSFELKFILTFLSQCQTFLSQCHKEPAKRNVFPCHDLIMHYNDVIKGAMASQITSLTIVYSTVYSDADQRKHQSSASLALVRGIHLGPVNSPHKWPVTQKMFPFDDLIMDSSQFLSLSLLLELLTILNFHNITLFKSHFVTWFQIGWKLC